MARTIPTTVTATVEIHVTRVTGRDVYGHAAKHCDEAGCNGTEQYYSELDGTTIERGSVVEIEIEIPVANDGRRYRGRARALDLQTIANRIATKALATGKWQYTAAHGGSVPNNYGYATTTETCVAIASPDGRVSLWLDAIPANKVTLGGVGAGVGARAIWDDRYKAGPAVDAAYSHLRSIHCDATGYVSPDVIRPGVDAEIDTAIECALITLTR